MKKLIFIFLLFNVVRVEAMVVETPTLDSLITKLDTQIDGNLKSQYLKTGETLTTMASQLEQAVRMSKQIADGEISKEMIDFAFNTAKQCGLTPPAIILKDFPDLKFNICKEPMPTAKITALFSFKDGYSTVIDRQEIQKNIDKIREDNYITSLTTALTTRSLDRTKTIQDFTKQMTNQSLANLSYVSNEIALSQLTELVEIRKLLALILEGQALDRASSFNKSSSK